MTTPTTSLPLFDPRKIPLLFFCPYCPNYSMALTTFDDLNRHVAYYCVYAPMEMRRPFVPDVINNIGEEDEIKRIRRKMRTKMTHARDEYETQFFTTRQIRVISKLMVRLILDHHDQTDNLQKIYNMLLTRLTKKIDKMSERWREIYTIFMAAAQNQLKPETIHSILQDLHGIYDISVQIAEYSM